MTAVKFFPKSLAQIRLERGEIGRELGSQIEMSVIHRTNLDPEFPTGDKPSAEPNPVMLYGTDPPRLPVNLEIYLKEGSKAIRGYRPSAVGYRSEHGGVAPLVGTKSASAKGDSQLPMASQRRVG